MGHTVKTFLDTIKSFSVAPVVPEWKIHQSHKALTEVFPTQLTLNSPKPPPVSSLLWVQRRDAPNCRLSS